MEAQIAFETHIKISSHITMFFFYIFILIYSLGCAGPLLLYVRASVFVAVCGNFQLHHSNPQLWHVGFSSLARDGTWAPCIGSMES